MAGEQGAEAETLTDPPAMVASAAAAAAALATRGAQQLAPEGMADSAVAAEAEKHPMERVSLEGEMAEHSLAAAALAWEALSSCKIKPR